jgi:hypothetical protein
VGQTNNTRHCESLMHKNGEQYVDNFVCAESLAFCYAVSHCLVLNLTNMCRKPLACFGLCVDTVSMLYHQLILIHVCF